MARTTDTAALLERDAELQALEAALDDALAGTGSLLMIEGAAGVGKSALLREFGGRAAASPARLLSAVGGELERDFPYGLVRQLLEPVVRGASAERREELLSGAAALAAPIVGGESAGDAETGDASYAVLHGLYWLLSALAEDEPLVLVLDDLHWADEPTLRFVDFLARRVSDLPLLVVLGLRPAEPGVDRALLDSITASAGDAVLHPALLSPDAVRAMVADRLGADGGEEVTTTAHETTGGNPLLLRELMRSLRGGEVTAQAVRAAVPSSVTRSVRRRLDALPQGAQELAAALAVLQDGGDAELAGRLTSQDERQTREHLRVLGEAEILMEGGEVRFLHPLVREAVAGSVSANDRDELHAAAAHALRNRPDAAEQLMIHLLAAPPSGEQWAIDLLVEGARRSLSEGAPEAAVRRLRRALEEGGGDAELLLELGLAELRAADLAARDHLIRAEEMGDPLVAARAVQARMTMEMMSGQVGLDTVAGALRGALDAIPESERESDVAEQVRGALVINLSLDPSLAGARGEFLSDPAYDDVPSVLGGRAFWEAGCEGHADDILDLCRRAWVNRPMTDVAGIERQTGTLPFGALFQIDAKEMADEALRDAEAAARRHGSRYATAHALQLRGAWNEVFGSAVTNETSCRAAYALGTELGLGLALNGTVASLVRGLARLGRYEEANAFVADLPEPEEPGWTDAMTHQARAALRLAEGRPHDAVADLEVVQAVGEALRYRRFPVLFPGVDMAFALAAAGRAEEAAELAAEEVAFAERTNRRSMLTSALTALGLAMGGDEGLQHLRRAVAESEDAKSPIARAQAHVEAGSAVRRAGQRTEARELLRVGADEAARADARPLHARATEELVVAGGKPRAAYSSGVDSLTPSERRVADLAASGLTNRQIAETLFVTQKTVEVHLGHTYGKLEIRSRTELGNALGLDSSPSA